MVVYLRETAPAYDRYRCALAAAGASAMSGGDPRCCDALLLPGGGDLDPALYGQPNQGSHPPDRGRDQEEMALLEMFIQAGKPVLGICRGMQALNVYFGGTLQQDLPGHGQKNGKDIIHGVDTAPSFLYNRRWTQVNSAHHQAVDRLGRGLRAIQWAEDGTVEGIVHEQLPVLGVQYHPERLGTNGIWLFRQFFKTFCEPFKKI